MAPTAGCRMPCSAGATPCATWWTRWTGAAGPARQGRGARLGGDRVGTGKSQELRAAIQRFRASGRFAFAFSESFGELGPGDRSYYIASAFDRIWLQPVGLVGLTGLSARSPSRAARWTRSG